MVEFYIKHVNRFAGEDPAVTDCSTNLLYIISFLQELWTVDKGKEKIQKIGFAETRQAYSILSAVKGKYYSTYFDTYWSLRVLRRMCLNFNLAENADNLITFDLKLSKFNNLFHMKAVHDYALANIAVLLMPDADNEDFIESFSDKLTEETGHKVLVGHTANEEYTQIIRDSFKIIDRRIGINSLISFAKEFLNSSMDKAPQGVSFRSREAVTPFIMDSKISESHPILFGEYKFQFMCRCNGCIKEQCLNCKTAFNSKLIIGAVSYYPSKSEYQTIIEKYNKDTTL